PYEVVVRQRHHRIEADRQEPFDLPLVDLADDLVGVHARLRQLLGRHPPDLGDVRPILGVDQVAAARQLVALLAVLAATLAVALAGDRRVATVWASDASRGQHDVDRAEHVRHAVRVVFEAAGVHQKAGLGGAPPLGGYSNRLLRDAGHLGGAPRGPGPDLLAHALE